MKKFFEKQHYRLLLVLVLAFNVATIGQEINSINSSVKVDSLHYPPNGLKIIPALNFKDTDIRDILRGIALEYKTNITVDNSINKRISVALFEISVFDAVKILTTDNGFEFRYDDHRFFVNVKKPEPSPPPINYEPEITFYDMAEKIDIDAKNVEINKFVEELRKVTGHNYLLTAGTSGNVTGKLKSIDFRTGLRNILQNNGFYFVEKDSIYYISRSAYFTSMENQGQNNHSPYWVSVQNNRISIDVHGASVNKILDDITNQLNLQVIKLDAPENNVTIKCNSVLLEQALYYLFKGSEFTFKKNNQAYVIAKTTTRNLESVKLLKLNHLRADLMIEKIAKKSFPTTTIQPIVEHNGLLIIGPQESIANLEEYIKTIDQPVPQVMIEALVVDYNLDNLFQFGINMATGDSTTASRPDHWFPGLDVTASGNKINKFFDDIGNFDLFGQNIDFGKVTLPKNFYANVKFLESNGVANVRSRPILSTLNGHTASLEIGTTQNYVFNEILPITSQTNSTFIQKETIQKIEANISFEITPWVGPDNQLTLELKPNFQTPVGQFSPDKKQIPSINTRSLESTVKLKGGETIIVGGLIQENEIVNKSKFPILGDIPFLGELFTNTTKSKTKAELLIYITPRIFYEDEYGYANYNYAEQ